MSQLIAPLAFVAALLSPPGHPTPAAHTSAVTVARHAAPLEIYQLTVRGPGPNEFAQSMILVIHSNDKGYSGYVLTNAHAVELDAILIDGDAVHATLRTTRGEGELTLNRSAMGIQGTLTVRGRTLAVTGERTL